MAGPLISVVIPTKDRRGPLSECLAALARQSLPPGSFEVVVVDDGSQPALELDGSRWRRFFETRLIRQANAGPSAARHRGVAEARGSLIAFTDDDCVPSAQWLAEMHRVLEANPDALLGGTTVNGLSEDVCAEVSQFILDLAYDYFNTGPEGAVFFASNNLACSRQVYLESGGFDPDYRAPAAEDRDFCDRWRMQGRSMLHVPAAIITHHHHQSFREFTRMYFRYGRGAWEYHRRRRQRGSGTMRRDLSFHRSLPRLLSHSLRQRYPVAQWPVVMVLLAWWQAMNAAGFVWEGIRTRSTGNSGRPPVPIPRPGQDRSAQRPS